MFREELLEKFDGRVPLLEKERPDVTSSCVNNEQVACVAVVASDDSFFRHGSVTNDFW